MSVVAGGSVLFSAAGLALFCASIVAVSFHYEALKNTNWVYIKNGDDHIYFGFRAAATKFGSVESVTHLTDCNNSTDDNICNKCGGDGGMSSEGLVAIALIFAGLALFVSLFRVSAPSNLGARIGQIITSLISLTFGIAAFSNYWHCYHELRDNFDHDNVHYGPGYGLCVAASALMIVAFVFGLIPSGEAGGNPAPVPTGENNTK